MYVRMTRCDRLVSQLTESQPAASVYVRWTQRRCGYTFPVHSRVRTQAECVRVWTCVGARRTCVAQPADSSPQCEKYVQTDRAYAYPSAAAETRDRFSSFSTFFLLQLCFYYVNGARTKIQERHQPRQSHRKGRHRPRRTCVSLATRRARFKKVRDFRTKIVMGRVREKFGQP